MNIIFAGTPEFAAAALQALISSHHRILAVYTQPDRPAGRGKKMTASPVKELALKQQLPVHQPVTLGDSNEQKILADYRADVFVVAAYGLILPEPVLNIYPCLNIHASLLPRWRGASPIQQAILSGDKETGITIMQMEKGLDTGPMLYKLACEIEEQDNAQTLHDKLAKLGAEAILYALDHLTQLVPEMQDEKAATYAAKIKKTDAKINWSLSAESIVNRIRAFNPWPVAFTELNKQFIRIWSAKALNKIAAAKPGEIISSSSEGIDVATGEGIVRILTLQLPGGKILRVQELLNAHQKDFMQGVFFK